MHTKIARCDVVEVPTGNFLGSEYLGGDSGEGPRDLLPWADPYIAAILTKHRLQAALDDSLLFVRRQADVDAPAKECMPRPSRRFTFPGS